jgi:hypothetical protein
MFAWARRCRVVELEGAKVDRGAARRIGAGRSRLHCGLAVSASERRRKSGSHDPPHEETTMCTTFQESNRGTSWRISSSMPEDLTARVSAVQVVHRVCWARRQERSCFQSKTAADAASLTVTCRAEKSPSVFAAFSRARRASGASSDRYSTKFHRFGSFSSGPFCDCAPPALYWWPAVS